MNTLEFLDWVLSYTSGGQSVRMFTPEQCTRLVNLAGKPGKITSPALLGRAAAKLTLAARQRIIREVTRRMTK